MPPPLLHDPALDLPTRHLLASLDFPIAVPEIEATELVPFDLEHRCAAPLRVEAVHASTRVRGAVKLRQDDQGCDHDAPKLPCEAYPVADRQ